MDFKSKLEGMDVGMDAEKLKKRRERFGLPVASSGGPDGDKKAARAARFAAKWPKSVKYHEDDLAIV